MQPAEVATLLRMLAANKSELVNMEYSMYRRRFSITAVPIVKSIPSKKTDDFGEPIPFIVWVDKQKAINFLKTTYNFLSREDLKKELHDASRDFSGVVQRE